MLKNQLIITGLVEHTTQTNPAVEQNTNVKCQEVHGISPVGEEMVYGVGEKKVLNTKNVIKCLSIKRSAFLHRCCRAWRKGWLNGS